MWKGVREFFTYTRKQRNGLLILVVIAVLLQVLLYFDDFWVQDDEQDLSRFRAAVAEWERRDSLAATATVKADSLFYFDPNTAGKDELVALGFSERLASTIDNYRSKGGQFRKPQDLMKIYTMDSALYSRVEAYVDIPPVEEKRSGYSEPKEKELRFVEFELNSVSAEKLEQMGLPAWQVRRIISFREKFRPFKSPQDLYKVYDLDSASVEKMLPFAKVEARDAVTKKARPGKVLVDINLADSLELMKVRGIGPAFAHRIIRYREKLGGFRTKEQLLEVYGIDEERFLGIQEQVVLGNQSVDKLDINTAGFKELLHHPYLEYEVVKNIVRFRERVRPFKSVEELQNIELIDAQLFSKIAPYLDAGSADDG